MARWSHPGGDPRASSALRAPASDLRSVAASSFEVGSVVWVGQFALSIPPRGVTVFRRDGFGPIARYGSRRVRDGLRSPLTPCALRLEEP
jgi:hypothetical protein